MRSLFPSFTRYELAIVVSASALALSLGLEAWLPDGMPYYVALVVAVFVVAADGGLRPALAAIFICTLVSTLILAGSARLGLLDLGDILSLLTFIGVAVLLGIAVSHQRSRWKDASGHAATNAKLVSRINALLEDQQRTTMAIRERAMVLKRNQDRLESLVSVAPLLLMEFDAEERLRFIGGLGQRWFDAPPKLGASLDTLISDEAALNKIRRVYDGEAIAATKGSFGRGTFETRWASHASKDGHTNRLMAVSIDVTQRDELDEALRQVEASLRFVLDSGGIGAFDWDLTANRLLWSETMERLHGVPTGAFAETVAAYLACVSTEDRIALRTLLDRAGEGQNDQSLDYWTVLPDGQRRRISIGTRATFDTAGSLLRMVGVAFDVTSRWEASERLMQEQSDKGRREGATLVASEAVHVFTNNITPAVGVMELLLSEKSLPDSVKSQLRGEILRLRAAAASSRDLMTFANPEPVALDPALSMGAGSGR